MFLIFFLYIYIYNFKLIVGDFASQAIVSITLKKYFPDFKLVGEENSQALKESNSLRKRVTGLVNDTLEEKYSEDDVKKS